MVLPGIQTLLGFQLIAVFQPPFSALPPAVQSLHLFAIVCVVVAVALVMTPAALHRLREPTSVSKRFVQLSSSLLMWSMPALALGLSCDVFIVAKMITRESVASAILGAAALAIFAVAWFVVPWRVRLE
jgi:hypothetical protein